MGLAESAAILLGIGIISSRFGAGTGLSQLGAGVQSLVAAPLTGTGTGLLSFATGLRAVFETFGDLGRGLGALFGAIPQDGYVLPENGDGQQLETWPMSGVQAYVGQLTLSPKSGGDYSTLLTGGGGNVPKAPTSPRLPSIPTGPYYLDRNVSMVDERQRAVMM